MTRPVRCSQCPRFPFSDGEFVARKLCVAAKRQVARKTPACDTGRGLVLFGGKPGAR